MRGTFSTGFHAPTAGQANVINITTAFVQGVLADVGTIPLTTGAGQFINDRRIAAGEDPFTLGPEESENFTVGFATSLGDLDITVDYFNITLDGRIATTSNLDFQQELRDFAAESGVDVTAVDNTNGILLALDSANALNISDFAGSEDLSLIHISEPTRPY